MANRVEVEFGNHGLFEAEANERGTAGENNISHIGNVTFDVFELAEAGEIEHRASDKRCMRSTEPHEIRYVLKIDDFYEWLRILVVDGSEVVSSAVFVHVKAAVDGDDSVHGR